MVGAGVVGTAMGVILSARGYEVTGIYDLNTEPTEKLAERIKTRVCLTPQEVSRSAEILFITTSDSSIADVVDVIARENGFYEGQLVVHMSGALSSKVLESAKAQGALTVSIHPMQSFANVDRAITNLPGSVFSIEGDRDGYSYACQLVNNLGGDYFFIDEKAKPLYHAGACIVSNYLVTIVDVGLQLLESIGIQRDIALKAFLPLIKGTVRNIEKIGVPQALTGPISRGDLMTVLKHLECLAEKTPQLMEIYSWLGYFTAEVAGTKGTIDRKAVDAFKHLFVQEMLSKSSIRAGGE
ncbi:MAG: Rossmann-like and DUF2520 domain-containing protein [Chitinophagales bacterium]